MTRRFFLPIFIFVIGIVFLFFSAKASYAQGTCSCNVTGNGRGCALTAGGNNCDSGYVASCQGVYTGCACECVVNTSCGDEGQPCCTGGVCSSSKLKCIYGICEVPASPKPSSTPSSGALPAKLSDLEGVFSNVVKGLLGLVAIVLLVILVASGFKMMSAGSDPKAVEAARRSLTMAITGLIVILLGYMILVLIYKITGVNVTIFRVFMP